MYGSLLCAQRCTAWWPRGAIARGPIACGLCPLSSGHWAAYEEHVVSELNRRRFLAGLAASTLVGVGAARCAVGATPKTLAAPVVPGRAAAPPAPPAPPKAANLLPPPPPAGRVPLPGGGVLNVLPGPGDLLALTVDDGVNSDVVRLYTNFAKDSGVRLTYFVNGTYKSWTDNLSMLRPLVESGQIQLGNHTWSHPDLTTLPERRIRDELTRNHEFLAKTYGIDATPYLRPPYGKHNSTVRAVAADLGYTMTTLWSGSLADSTRIAEDYIVKMAGQYFTAQSVVIGHLNHLPVTHVYGQLVDIIRSRNLRTVTLNDVFSKPEVTRRTAS
jgi:peptidoglycan-N-acetylglucosamine deacetylase